MSKLSTMFRSVSYGPCSRTGVTCVKDMTDKQVYKGTVLTDGEIW